MYGPSLATVATVRVVTVALFKRRLSPRAAVLLLALGMACAAGCVGDPGPTPRRAYDDKPNVLLVSIDSLRADHLGFMGYERATSPVMDRLARSAVVFDNAHSSSSWTLPAHAALMTGLPDSAHGVSRGGRALPAAAETLAEAFRVAGYRTMGFYSGPFLHPVYGFGRGFDEYVDCSSYGLGSADADPKRLHSASHRDVTGPIVKRELEARVASLGRGPWFVFVHLWDVHYDYIPPAPYDTMFDPDYTGSMTGVNFKRNRDFKPGMDEADRRHVLALYDGEIAWTDNTLGSLVRALLAEQGDLDNSIVVVTSDHGDEFLEHGGKGHRRTLYEEVLKIPLLLHWPAGLKSRRVSEAVGLVDLAPTLLDLAGLPPMASVVGSSLAGLARGGVQADRAVLAELNVAPHLLSAVVQGQSKLITRRHGRRPEYFDLRSDPGEQRPLPADSGGALSGRLRGLLNEAEQRALKPLLLSPSDLSPAMEEQLRQLGYLD